MVMEGIAIAVVAGIVLHDLFGWAGVLIAVIAFGLYASVQVERARRQ
jgi:hypothetical protein